MENKTSIFNFLECDVEMKVIVSEYALQESGCEWDGASILEGKMELELEKRREVQRAPSSIGISAIASTPMPSRGGFVGHRAFGEAQCW